MIQRMCDWCRAQVGESIGDYYILSRNAAYGPAVPAVEICPPCNEALETLAESRKTN